jgi:hypothetical protein
MAGPLPSRMKLDSKRDLGALSSDTTDLYFADRETFSA